MWYCQKTHFFCALLNAAEFGFGFRAVGIVIPTFEFCFDFGFILQRSERRVDNISKFNALAVRKKKEGHYRRLVAIR